MNNAGMSGGSMRVIGEYPLSHIQGGTKQGLDETSSEIQDAKPVITQDLHWSADGFTLTSVSSDRTVRRFVLSQDNAGDTPSLSLFSKFSRNQSIVTSAVSLPDRNILLCCKNLPIQLYPLQNAGECTTPGEADYRPTPTYSYSTVNGQTEEFETPYSIRFLSPCEFITGSVRNSVSLYDVERREPLWHLRSDKLRCGRAAYKSIVSCFEEPCVPRDDTAQGSLNPAVLHFGTYKNEMYRVDLRTAASRRGKAKPLDVFRENNRRGNGIYQILRSDNDMYMYVLKRQSDVIEVHDLRRLGENVSTLQLPFKVRNQKFRASLSAYNGLSIGTTHGTVETWNRSLVESGGVSQHTQNNNPIPPTSSTAVNWGNTSLPSRINIFQQNPENAYIAAVSFSPDKTAPPFSPDKTDPPLHAPAAPNSGICIVEHT